MVKVDYHAVPHAVFTYPEIASVGLREKEALEEYGKDNVLIGIQRYQDTAILKTLKKKPISKGLVVIYSIFFISALIEVGFVQLLWLTAQ